MSLRLHQTFGAHAGRSFEFEQPVIRIGRLPSSDIAFDPHADLDASGRHAEIRHEAGGWMLTDVGSRNGTFVNGERVQQHVLVNGDELEFGTGGPRLRVEIVASPAVHAPPGPMARPGDATLAATPAAADSATGELLSTPRSSPSVPGEAAPSAPKRYGERTVAFMIRDALASAKGRRRRHQVFLLLFVGLLVVVGALAWILLHLGQERTGPDPAQIAAANAAALYRVVERPASGSGRVLCTAFAVRRGMLATTARCVLAIEEGRASGSRVEVRGAVGPAPIVRLWRHPAFVLGTDGPDVGLVEIGGLAPHLVTLAPLSRLRRIQEGHRLLAYGFQGDAARVTPLEVAGVGGDVRAIRFRHAAEVAPGAPIFDEDGVVVGIHSAELSVLPGSAGGVGGYAVGSDALVALLAGLGR